MVLRLFIIEPLESFDARVESDLDVSNIRPFRFGVKRNKFGAPTLLPSRDPPRVNA
jgi:hypothetical protein